MRTVLIVCGLSLALLTAAAAGSGETKPARVGASKAAPSKQAALTDAQLEAAIRARFAKSKINEDKFQVRVQGGVATVEGRTDVIQHKGTATRLAKAAGAVAVNNHIQPSEAAKQKAAANLETGRRRAQIKRGDTRSDPRSNATPAKTAPPR